MNNRRKAEIVYRIGDVLTANIDISKYFSFELFSPYTLGDDLSNNCSIVVKITGLDSTGFTYLVTGDTETSRWERIDAIFGSALRSDVLSAPHHGARTGMHVPSLLNIKPHTVLISAGVGSPYSHPEQRRVWLPAFFTPWKGQWEKEVFSFPSSRFNDQVDAFSWALSWIFRIRRARLTDAAFNRQLDSFSLFR